MDLLFSVTKKDFTRQTFCTGGNGGQHRNATQNGVRLIHEASGARAEYRDGRDQFINERKAFLKLIETREFKHWHRNGQKNGQESRRDRGSDSGKSG